MRPGQRGLCFVRGRPEEGTAEDGVALLTYGRSSGYCVDPVEKKPLNHFLPGTSVLSFGTAGCNLACRFCQNWDISKSKEMDTLADAASPAGIAAAARRLGCASVAFTYNDPTIFLEYASDVADACHEVGVKAIAVTAGYICPEPRADFYAHLDALNVDLKGFTEEFYKRVCIGHLEPVLETLEYLRHETDLWFEITTLLIPGHNDGDAELDELTAWVAEHLGPDVPLHFTAFHPDFKMMDVERTPPATLTRAREWGLRNGLRYVYTGNVHDRAGSSTWCPGCGTLLMERDWYELGAWGLTHDGRCRGCGWQVPGRFAGPPGRWGRRRAPVRLAVHSR
jgi:pyruvate formate lyase activating enzyme